MEGTGGVAVASRTGYLQTKWFAAQYDLKVCRQAGGASEHTNAKGGAQNHKKPDVHIFQITISVRDDWLHRGDALQDMDLQTYAEYIQRQAKPIRGSELRQTLAWQIFAFDAHYKIAQ